MTIKIKLRKPLRRKMMVIKDVVKLELNENELIVTNKSYMQSLGKNLFSKVIIVDKK